MPDFYAEPYLHLAGLSHKSALITWGAFYFKTKANEPDFKLVDDSDLKHVFPSRRQSIGAASESYGPAEVTVRDRAGTVVKKAPTTTKNHVWVTGLEPDTEYRYQVEVKGDLWASGGRRDWVAEKKGLELRGRSYENVFRTLPDPTAAFSQPVSFAVIGDFGAGVRKPGAKQQDIANALEALAVQRNIRFIVTTGDNIYAQKKLGPLPVGGQGDEDDDWFFTFYQPYRYLINRMPVYPCIGNHDSSETEERDDRSQLVDNFYIEERTAADIAAGRASVGPGLFYRFRVGANIELIALDTSREPELFSKRLLLHPNHRQFLEEAFPPAGSAPVWRLPFGHHPPFCAGPQHKNTKEFADPEFNLLERFEQAGVRVVFSGHEHNFQCARRGSTLFVVTGGAAKVRPQRPDPGDMAKAHTVCWSAECHFTLVTIDGDTMTLEPITGTQGNEPTYVRATDPAGAVIEMPMVEKLS